MKRNEMIHGFRVDSIRHFEQIKGDVIELTHVKTLAKMMYIDRKDDNKTFAIAFKTVPSDDTGVFHILEHSVLNGSRRYPVKEPFVDLLKGSLQTFLNAMTYPDKTVYPVCSRNEKDFTNLMRVYLDSVFFPNCLKDPNIFYQEGWHLEMDEGRHLPQYKGVVYNEMKGAFSSKERLASQAIMADLYPDTCYRYCSGGDPKAITDLSYEQFCASHKKFYHPGNSFLILDGSMDIDAILKIIDEEYLNQFDRYPEKIVFAAQPPRISPAHTVPYALSSQEDETERYCLCLAYHGGDFDDRQQQLAFEMIATALTATNQSPLCKALIDADLAENVSMEVNDGLRQFYLEIDVVNTAKEKLEEVQQVIEKTLKEVVKDGLDKEDLRATLNKAEFSYRERDFHGVPKGLVYGLSALDSWLYDGDPASGFIYDEVFDNLREKIESDYFENLIHEKILCSNHHAAVILEPSKTLEEEESRQMKIRMEALARTMSDEQRQAVLKLNRELIAHQLRQDTPEQKATLPKLALKDLDLQPARCDYRKETVNDIPVLYFDQDCEGIDYCHLFFNVADLSDEQLKDLSLMTSLIQECPSENYSLLELNKQIKTYIGDFSIGLDVIGQVQKRDYSLQLSVRYSCLDQYRDKALELVLERLYRTRFDDEKTVLDLIRQLKNDTQQSFVEAGHRLAMKRAAACLSEDGVILEMTSGYSFYTYLKELTEHFDRTVLTRIQELYQTVFTNNRLTLAMMGDNKEQTANRIIGRIAQDERIVGKVPHYPLTQKKQGIVIPSKISYSAASGPISDTMLDQRGLVMLINKILSLDYLWNKVRAENGAYGTGAALQRMLLSCYSYRDPSAAKSLEVFKASPAYLKDFVESDADLLTYIIGCIGDFAPALTNSGEMVRGEVEYFSQSDFSLRLKAYQQVLKANKKGIEKLIGEYDEVLKAAAQCVVGPEEELKKLDDFVINTL